MRRYYKKIFLLAIASACITSCTKTIEEPLEQLPISIGVSEKGSTKALLNATTFKTDGNRIQVYDIYTNSENEVSVYINAFAGPDVSSQSSLHRPGQTWPFEDKETGAPKSYNWTPDGIHKFFGWLAKDANFGTTPMTPETFFGSGKFVWNPTEYELSISALTMTPTTPQFDFLYSDVHVRNLNQKPDFTTPVALNFSHLFTAFSIGAWNTSNSTVKITKFELQQLKNINSATINWAGEVEEPVVTYGTLSSSTSGSSPFRQLETAAYTLGENARILNIFKGPQQNEDEVYEYLLMWPQASSDVHSTAEITENEDGTTTYPPSYLMYIEYEVTDDKGVTSTLSKRLNFPDLPWEAGKKYHFDVVFADKIVELIAKVNKWEHEPQQVDWTNSSVTLKDNHLLTWDENSAEVHHDTKQIFIVNGQPVKGSFTLDAPQGGTWIVSLEGDVDAFSVTPNNGEIDGSTATILIKPLVGEPKRDYKVTLSFAVRRTDGRVIAANDPIQKIGDNIVKYTIILPSN